ncbi:Dipeptidyl aminopeptidase/acylaminoacyl peptidase [Halovenus aranensis]|uniref:Dipeptidyl aminopeptidase/acylaminoacyl peptidase n=1 Tax=Halovenus aranensis TaxID=890420 RepID=A0A1G8WBG8_9EURY|nr:S9 family peptidase [Halovenus aranensis]SDJ75591.1 Dipeptidyl aminopeptidase/acylaminoacyl peptidase [Halovenus aranensis]
MLAADALYDITRIRDAAVSPTGERVAFLTQEYDPDEEESVNSLWVAPTDGSREPHRLTRASDGSSPAWSPDGSMLAFVATRERDPDLRVGHNEDESDDPDETADAEGDTDEEDSAGAGDPKPQVWAFDMELGGDASQLTDHEEGVSAFDWGPDGDRLVVAARDPTEEEQAYLDQREDNGPIEVERLQHKYDGTGYLDEVTSYLFVVDVTSRETERIDEANDGGHGSPGGLQPAWGPGDRIAYVASHTEWPDDSYVTDIYTIDPAGEDRRKLTESDHAAASPVWSPDGEHLAFTARRPDNWYVPTELCVTDGTEFWTVTDGIDRTLGRVAPQWVDEETLVTLIGDEGQTRFLRCDREGGPERVYERQDSLETVGTMDLGGGTLVFQVSVPTAGADLFALGVDELTAGDAERTRLTGVNDEFLDDHQVPDCRRLRFEGARGDEVEGLLYYPDDFDPEDPDERGLILNIHGGPMTYDAPGFRFQNAYFTSRGYLVFRVNYHGSTSYGRAFCESLNGEWGIHEVTDLLAGVDELLDRGWADPDRLFPTGFSQGGVNTGYLVTQDDRWAAAAAEHGIYDLRSSFGTDDSQNWLEADFGLPWENPEAYDEASAITEVENVETPLLVTAGENDHRCPPSQSEQLYVSVRKQGIDAKLVIYPDEHHNVGDPDRAIHRLETLDSWFASYDPERESEK